MLALHCQPNDVLNYIHMLIYFPSGSFLPRENLHPLGSWPSSLSPIVLHQVGQSWILWTSNSVTHPVTSLSRKELSWESILFIEKKEIVKKKRVSIFINTFQKPCLIKEIENVFTLQRKTTCSMLITVGILSKDLGRSLWNAQKNEEIGNMWRTLSVGKRTHMNLGI